MSRTPNWRSTVNPKITREAKAAWWHEEEKRLEHRRDNKARVKKRAKGRKARKNPACWLK